MEDYLSYQHWQGLAFHIPVEGRDVLSLGGYDARYAQSTLARGARSVTCVDSGQWALYNWSPPEQLEGVTYVTADLMDWTTPADIVEYSNGPYHSKTPWTTFEHIRSLTRERLLLTCPFIPHEDPVWRVEDDHEPRHCYFRPSLSGLFAVLRNTGFAEWEEVGRIGDHIILRCTPT